MNYLRVKKIDVPIEEDMIVGSQLPRKNCDYTLLVRVGLVSKEVTQVENDEEDETVRYLFEVNGPIQLVPVELNEIE